ncbi:energy-coupling factor transporter ATP-binding protein EcfA2 [Bradyrhizobium japonicum]
MTTMMTISRHLGMGAIERIAVMFENSKMPAKFADWSREDRVSHMAFRFIKTPCTKAIDKALGELFWPAGLDTEGEGCFVIGQTGAGKTTAVRMFTDRVYEELRTADPSGSWYRPKVFGTDLSPIVHKTPNGLRRPVAVVWVDPRPRFNAFMAHTALALGIDLGGRFNFGQACIEVAAALQEQQVKMILFDDVQHIVEAEMDTEGAGDVLKVLAKGGIQVVCIGLPRAVDLEQNAQFERLVADTQVVVPFHCSIGDFPQTDEDGKVIGTERQRLTPFRKFMASVDHRDGNRSFLPFDKPSHLSMPDMALRIHQAGEGHAGKIMKLIKRAARGAITDGSEWITKKHFEDAYRKSSRCSDEANWFRLSFDDVQERFGSVRVKMTREEVIASAREDDLVESRPVQPKPTKAKGKPRNKSPLSDRAARDVEDAIAGRR